MAFSIVIAVGVVYNDARIALSMRARDLASLRVLGFTRREISTVLVGELVTDVMLAIAARARARLARPRARDAAHDRSGDDALPGHHVGQDVRARGRRPHRVGARDGARRAAAAGSARSRFGPQDEGMTMSTAPSAITIKRTSRFEEAAARWIRRAVAAIVRRRRRGPRRRVVDAEAAHGRDRPRLARRDGRDGRRSREDARSRPLRRRSAARGRPAPRRSTRPGDRVRAGDVLARIVPAATPLLDSRSRSEAQTRVAAAIASQKEAAARKARAEVADRARAQRSRRRATSARERIVHACSGARQRARGSDSARRSSSRRATAFRWRTTRSSSRAPLFAASVRQRARSST